MAIKLLLIQALSTGHHISCAIVCVQNENHKKRKEEQHTRAPIFYQLLDQTYGFSKSDFHRIRPDAQGKRRPGRKTGHGGLKYWLLGRGNKPRLWL